MFSVRFVKGLSSSLLFSSLLFSSLLVMSMVIVGTDCDASEAYLADVLIDVASYEETGQEIFRIDVDADTPTWNVCENVTAEVRFFNAARVYDYVFQTPWQVCGPEFHPESQTLAYDPSSVESTLGLSHRNCP